MTAAHYKGGHPPGNDLGLHYTALPPVVASCPHSDQLLVTRKFWSPGANRPSQVSCAVMRTRFAGFTHAVFEHVADAELAADLLHIDCLLLSYCCIDNKLEACYK